MVPFMSELNLVIHDTYISHSIASMPSQPTLIITSTENTMSFPAQNLVTTSTTLVTPAPLQTIPDATSSLVPVANKDGSLCLTGN